MRVLNRYKDKWNSHTCVDIMRGSRWGNPFVLHVDGTRDEIIKMFKQYAEFRLTIQPNWLERLRGKDLWCCCKPEPCHGDVLLAMLEDMEESA